MEFLLRYCIFFFLLLLVQLNNAFENEDPEDAVASIIDSNLGDIYPVEDVYKVGLH